MERCEVTEVERKVDARARELDEVFRGMSDLEIAAYLQRSSALVEIAAAIRSARFGFEYSCEEPL